MALPSQPFSITCPPAEMAIAHSLIDTVRGLFF